MNRITRHQLYLEMCHSLSKRSTCFRANVGAILVGSNHNILSIGYNGPPSGEPHCTGLTCERTESGGCKRSLHAEANAIQRAPKKHSGGCTLYCTYSPCAACTQTILAYPRISAVIFQVPYRIDDHLRWMFKAGTFVGRVTPNGMLINEETKELVEGLPP